ncbi:MAG: MaoC/PaaZ C-terminal domain-containing protein [bacterium]
MAANLTLDQIEKDQALPELDIDVSVTNVVLGALATRDWRPMHHDKDFAVERNGTRHVFVNTPHNAAYFERYITDWTGPKGRLGRIKFRMKDSVFPDDTMSFTGKVSDVRTDAAGCGWADIVVALKVGEKIATTCEASIALPTDAEDNPWKRGGADWKP